MQKVPSGNLSQTPSDKAKTSSKAAEVTKSSSSSKKGDDTTKKPADNTDHTTVSSSFCGCKKDKCDAFFDKLLSYLEKQSDVIAKCCAHTREHKTAAIEKPFASDQEILPKRPSPCKDEPTQRRASTETQISLKGKAKSKDNKENTEESESKISRYQSALDVGKRGLKLGDKPCNIYVEVCSCQKNGRTATAKSPPRTVEMEPDPYPSRHQGVTQPECTPSGKSNEYGFDCHGCEKKVSHFFKLAEEICQGYMKQCQERENMNRAQSTFSGNRPAYRESFSNTAPSMPNQAQRNEACNDEAFMKPEKLSAHEYGMNDRPCARPIAIEIECQGARQEIIVEPCQCVEKIGNSRMRTTPVPSRCDSQTPKKSCLEVFEERYGKILRDLHCKLFGNQSPIQNSAQPSYPNPYGDYTPQQPNQYGPQQPLQPNPYSPQPMQPNPYGPQQNPYGPTPQQTGYGPPPTQSQPTTNPKPTPAEQPRDSNLSEESTESRKKKKDKKDKKKKKGSKSSK